MQLAEAAPHRFSHLINLDGLPSKKTAPDISEHERTRQTLAEVGGWLDHRRRTHHNLRKPGTLDELAARRGRMNPRLSEDWLRYLVSVGARQDHDGWRWKIDPSMRFGGFGPWRPEWSMERAPGVGVPFLGVLGLAPEEMGWGSSPDDVVPYLPPGAEFHPLDDVGHFVHIEQPELVSGLVLDFLDRRTATRVVSSVDQPDGPFVADPQQGHLACLHRLRSGDGARPAVPARAGERTPPTHARRAGAVARARLGAGLHRPRRIDGPARRRLHLRAADGRRRHRPRPSGVGNRAGSRLRAHGWRCCWLGPGPTRLRAPSLPTGRSGRRRHPSRRAVDHRRGRGRSGCRAARPLCARRAVPRRAPGGLCAGLRPRGGTRFHPRGPAAGHGLRPARVAPRRRRRVGRRDRHAGGQALARHSAPI